MTRLQELVTQEREENFKKYKAKKDVEQKEMKLRQSNEKLLQSKEKLVQSETQLTILKDANPDIKTNKYNLDVETQDLRRESDKISKEMQKGITTNSDRFHELKPQIREKMLEQQNMNMKIEELTKAQEEVTKAQKELTKAQEEVTKAQEEVTKAQKELTTITTNSNAQISKIQEEKALLHNNKKGGKKSKKYRKKSRKYKKSRMGRFPHKKSRNKRR